MKDSTEEEWKKFEEWLADHGKECNDCEYLKSWQESRGEFWGAPCSETMYECAFEDDDQPKKCPAFQSYLEGEDDEGKISG